MYWKTVLRHVSLAELLPQPRPWCLTGKGTRAQVQGQLRQTTALLHAVRAAHTHCAAALYIEVAARWGQFLRGM